MTLSIIIPALNETQTIASTVRSVLDPASISIEIIVVDNGSDDDTAAIATSAGARVIAHRGGTIANLRNVGVAASQGNCLVFLDADVRVLPGWHDRIAIVMQRLETQPMLVTGSRLQTAGNGGFLERHWFARLGASRSHYINSGHLVTSRQLFDAIGGFDPALQTAEDHDFCSRARAHGATIEDDPALAAVHEGYPTSWLAFVRREAWHGGQDFSSLTRIRDSRVAWVAVFNLCAMIAALVAAVLGYLVAIPVYLLAMYALCLVLSKVKFHGLQAPAIFATSLVFFAYIWGRTLAMLPAFRRRRK